MKINKAVITAAGSSQRKLPLQTLIDTDGCVKSVLQILLNEIFSSGIEEVAIVINPEDEKTYREVISDEKGDISFVYQTEQLGYGHALYCAKDFIAGSPFLHLVGDHLYVSKTGVTGASQLVKIAEQESCSVSAVQPTRESQIPMYGVVGGQRYSGQQHVYKVDVVIEKPTPTEAEQKLLVPGLRAGHYLCFFGMHVLTPSIMTILEENLSLLQPGQRANLADALSKLMKREQYLAAEMQSQRYDVGAKYGLFKAQLALALNGVDRDRLMSEMLEFYTMRELDSPGR